MAATSRSSRARAPRAACSSSAGRGGLSGRKRPLLRPGDRRRRGDVEPVLEAARRPRFALHAAFLREPDRLRIGLVGLRFVGLREGRQLGLVLGQVSLRPSLPELGRRRRLVERAGEGSEQVPLPGRRPRPSIPGPGSASPPRTGRRSLPISESRALSARSKRAPPGWSREARFDPIAGGRARPAGTGPWRPPPPPRGSSGGPGPAGRTRPRSSSTRSSPPSRARARPRCARCGGAPPPGSRHPPSSRPALELLERPDDSIPGRTLHNTSVA